MGKKEVFLLKDFRYKKKDILWVYNYEKQNQVDLTMANYLNRVAKPELTQKLTHKKNNTIAF